jgi:hypothetical protein
VTTCIGLDNTIKVLQPPAEENITYALIALSIRKLLQE